MKKNVKENLEKTNDIILSNEEIFFEVNRIYGLANADKKLAEYTLYIEELRKKKIEYGNLNILIQSESSYDEDEKFLNLIIQLLINENVIKNRKDIERVEAKSLYSLKDIEEFKKILNSKVIIIDISNGSIENIKKLIKEFEDNIFIFVQKLSSNIFRKYEGIETRQVLSGYFYWNFKINLLKEDDKKDFIINKLNENNIKINNECKLIDKLSKLQFYKIKEEILRIIVNCIDKNICEISNININKVCDIDNLKNDIDEKNCENYKDNYKKEKIELDSLIGLSDVKNQIYQITNFIKVKKNRNKMPMLHMVFEGNPGTGKTTVARAVGKIFVDNNILSKDAKFVEVDREKLIGKYVGWTASKTKEAIKEAKGGILFVDEAYSLSELDNHSDFGYEAISTLIKEMEDNRNDLCVILAGYTDKMEKLLNSNPGFQSRIQFKIKFPDYTSEELYEVFKNYCKKEQYNISNGIKNLIIEYFENEKGKSDFGNARCARSFFEKIEIEQANRIVNNNIKSNTITKSDVINTINKMQVSEETKEKRKIGFVA